ncbi:MAG: hypothetical protein OXH85_12900 [Truepera sp.]|nr:hypothetical protein [Truepera sp.]
MDLPVDIEPSEVLDAVKEAARPFTLGWTARGLLGKAAQKFDRNSTKFARKLAKDIAEWKKEGLVSNEQLAAALENPDFDSFFR